jgi:chromosome segregation ATPase
MTGNTTAGSRVSRRTRVKRPRVSWKAEAVKLSSQLSQHMARENESALQHMEATESLEIALDNVRSLRRQNASLLGQLEAKIGLERVFEDERAKVRGLELELAAEQERRKEIETRLDEARSMVINLAGNLGGKW